MIFAGLLKYTAHFYGFLKGSSMNNINRRLINTKNKIISSPNFKYITDLLLGKYLYFVILMIMSFCTVYIAKQSLGATDTVLYYSLNGDSGRYLPESLIGFYTMGIHDIGTLISIYKVIYLAVLAFSSLLYYTVIRRVSPNKEKAKLLAISALVIFIIFCMLRNYMFVFNAYISGTLIAASVILFKKQKALPLIPLLLGLAQLSEPVTVLCLIPLFVSFPFLTCLFDKKTGKIFAAVCLSSIFSVVLVLVITQHFSGKDLIYIKELYSSGTNEGDFYFLPLYFSPICNDGLTKTVFEYITSNLSLRNFSVNFRECSYIPVFISVFIFLKMINCKQRKYVSFLILFFVYYAVLFFTGKENILFFIFLVLFEAALLSRTETYRAEAFPAKLLCTALAMTCIFAVIRQPIHLFTEQDYVYVPYYVSYSDLGFVQRAFIGTIFKAIFGYTIHPTVMMYSSIIYYTANAILLIILIFCFYKQISDKQSKLIYSLIIAAFLTSTAFSNYFSGNLLRFDLYNDVITMLALLLTVQNQRTMFFIPVLCIAAIMIHQGYISISFPIVFSALLYRAFINPDGHSLRNKTIFILTFAFVVCGFFYFTFFSSVQNGITFTDIENMISERSAGFINDKSVYTDTIDLWLDDSSAQLVKYKNSIYAIQRLNALKVALTNLPLLAMYIYAFGITAKKESKFISKAACIISMLSVFALTPLFIAETDYGRWCAHYLFILIFGIAALTIMQRGDKKWYSGISGKALYIWTALIIISSMLQPEYFVYLKAFALRFI